MGQNAKSGYELFLSREEPLRDIPSELKGTGRTSQGLIALCIAMVF